MNWKLFSMNKRGQAFDRLAAMAVGILSVTITLVFTFLFLAQGTDQIGDTQAITCTGNSSTVPGGGGTSVACNATKVLTSAVADIPGWVGLIVLAGIAVVILGLVQLFRRNK